MRDVPVNVLLRDGVRADAVVAELRAAGLRVEQVMDAIGAVTGRVPEAELDALRAVPGVSAVEAAGRDFQLPPPDAPVQ